jgi:hypothetical protein
MNIFVTSRCPVKSAKRLWNNPVRARKMITESLQMVSIYLQYNNYENIKKVNNEYFSYSKTILGNKVTKWVLKNSLHFEWLVDHVEALYKEYEGQGFKNVPNCLNVIRKYTTEYYDDKYNNIIFYNQAGSKSKGLDYTNLKCVFTAYDMFLKAQNS